MRRLSNQGLLALLCVALCFAVVGAVASPVGRGLLLVTAEDDDDETFNFDFERDNIPLTANSTLTRCFDHKVSCVKYEIRARKDAKTRTPARVLALVLPIREARKAEEQRVVASRYVLPGSLCQGENNGFCRGSVKVNDKDNLCVLIANADIRFKNPRGVEFADFTVGEQGDVFLDVDIEGCATTSQKIVAIAVPIAVFVGVAACLSTWWIRRRRKGHMPSGGHPTGLQGPQAHPPPGYPPAGQLPSVGSAGVPPAPPPLVTPAPGAGPVTNPTYGAGMVYGPAGGYGPQVVFGAQPGYVPGGMNPGYSHGQMGMPPGYGGASTRPVAKPDGYPIVVANV